MHRVPANSKVRRRLFSEDNIEDQARVDNLANILQESAARDMQEKSKKWNFDFKNEVPLPGDYEWYIKSENEWIGMKTGTGKDLEEFEKDKCNMKKIENERTPIHFKDDSVPIIRKRRRDIEKEIGKTVRRRVEFDECSFLRRLAF